MLKQRNARQSVKPCLETLEYRTAPASSVLSNSVLLLAPTDDAPVLTQPSSRADENHGATPWLEVFAGDTQGNDATLSAIDFSFLRFDLSDITAPVASLKLHLHTLVKSGIGQPHGGEPDIIELYHVTNDNWWEGNGVFPQMNTSLDPTTGITGTNFGQPFLDGPDKAAAPIATTTAAEVGIDTVFDLSDFDLSSDLADGFLTVAVAFADVPNLQPNSMVVRFSSKEGAFAPYLEVETGPPVHVFQPTDDAMILTAPSNRTQENAGGWEFLEVFSDPSATDFSFLRFDVSSLQGETEPLTLQRLHLRLAGRDGNPAVQNPRPLALFHVANDVWAEGTGSLQTPNPSPDPTTGITGSNFGQPFLNALNLTTDLMVTALPQPGDAEVLFDFGGYDISPDIADGILTVAVAYESVPQPLSPHGVVNFSSKEGTSAPFLELGTANQSPTADAGGPYGVSEGSSISLNGSSSSDPDDGIATYEWDFDYDGTNFNVAATGVTPNFNAANLDGPLNRTIAVRVTDNAGASDIDTATVTVNNVAPSATITGPTVGVVGQPLSFTLGASDPAPADEAAGYAFAIDWDGDGTTDQIVTGPNGSPVEHTFANEGTFTIKVTASDKDNGISPIATHSPTIAKIGLQNGNLVVGGTTGDDDIVFKKGPTSADIEAILNGTSLRVFQPTGRLIAYGREGNDRIEVKSAVTLPGELYGNDGDDTLIGGKGDDDLFGGDGADRLDGNRGNDLLEGGAGDDDLNGNQDDDTLRGGGGADHLEGGYGDDVLEGGEGDDTLKGNQNDDVLHGEDGNDRLEGGYGDDVLLGGEGDDTLLGNQGIDSMDGGAGYDVLEGGYGDDFLAGGAGNDTLEGNQGKDILRGDDGADSLDGGYGADILLGGNAADQLFGGVDADLLIGGLGADLLNGQNGGDLLIGGTTAHDADDAALRRIRDEWNSNRNYENRIANLRDGSGSNGLNGSTFLQPGVTVLDDEEGDSLTGGAGIDWFFLLALDIATDVEDDEVTN